MSLTFKVQPQELMPTYNPVVIVATSSQQAQLNYQLVSSIYCRGSLVTKMKTPVNPEGYMVVDIHKHLENRISFDFNPGLTGFSIATQSFASYSVSFADEFRENWYFTDNQFNLIGATGYTGFIGPVGGPQPNYTVGESIFVTQNDGYQNASYNGVHTIISITYSASKWKIVTDALWASSSPANPGYITYPNFQLTTIASTYSIPEKYAFNGVLSFQDYRNWNYDDWDTNTSTPGRFFTNAPTTGLGNDTDYELDILGGLFLNLYQNANSEIRYLKVRTSAGTYSITNPYTSISTNDQCRFLQVNASPYYFYTLGWLNSSTKYMELWIENSVNQRTTKIYKFKISDKCSKYERMQLLFMDKMGSFVSYTFNLVNRQTKNINKTDYQQFYGSYAPASQNWTYNTWDRGRKSLDVVTVDSYTLNSDWVNQDTSNYLMELFESPEVYLVTFDGLNYLIEAINVTVQSTERKQVINEQIINYTLTFEKSNKNSSQRG